MVFLAGSLSVDICEYEIFSLMLKRFLSYLGQHDVFIEFVPFKIILNLKKYSDQSSAFVQTELIVGFRLMGTLLNLSLRNIFTL